jgi:uncharacterized protein YndB with AHSA1/START domain
MKLDPTLDLILERVVDVPREKVWRAWTQPEHLKKWFCPRPWQTVECEVDLRPGGVFRTVLRGPEGESHENLGCWLEVVPQERLVWTIALGPGWRPVKPHAFVPPFTCVLTFEAQGKKTRYRAVAMHVTPDAAQAHDRMGFSQGWGTALDQLVEVAPRM